MRDNKKNKPIWNKKQVAKVKRYLQSDECAKRMKEINAKWEEEERQNKQEEIEWWTRIKDEPYGMELKERADHWSSVGLER